LDLYNIFLLTEIYNKKIKTLKPKVLIGKNISEVLKSSNNGKKDMKIKIKKYGRLIFLIYCSKNINLKI
tara:strand:- start:60 stop:266 length:207 start_codon:yes stop_codon:yes gene_type:complete